MLTPLSFFDGILPSPAHFFALLQIQSLYHALCEMRMVIRKSCYAAPSDANSTESLYTSSESWPDGASATLDRFSRAVGSGIPLERLRRTCVGPLADHLTEEGQEIQVSCVSFFDEVVAWLA